MQRFNIANYADDARPGRLPKIAGNARNHGNEGKFHESHKILNQI